jgi:hypothetical protein
MSEGSSLYWGEVLHQRLRPRRHRLRYRVFWMLIDLDELPAVSSRLRLFSHNRFNLFTFYDRDHGPGDGQSLRPWVQRHLEKSGVDFTGGRVRLLCFPRVLGYGFNPLSVYFCYHRDGTLHALLYEVNNTFGERHSYLIPVGESASPTVHQRCDKCLYVSPFNPVAGGYRFHVLPPDRRVAVAINQDDDHGPLLNAWMRAERRPLTDGMLLASFLRFPFLTLKVILGIHWEALRLWRKGMRLVPRPAPPPAEISVVEARQP